MRLFLFGMGYSAAATVAALGAEAEAVSGTGRTPALGRHVFDGTAPGATLGPHLRAATHVVLSIPPGPDGDPALLHHRADLDAAPLQWLCYLSSIGVYGDAGGGTVDESTPPRPGNERAQRRLAAEQGWEDYARARGLPLLVLRLAGIYGPGRSALDRLRAGTARRIVKPGQVFNRIHVADIGRIAALAARRTLAGTYNLSDAEPAPPQEVIAHAARLLGLSPPPEEPFETADMTARARAFYGNRRRVDGTAIERALGISLLYPSYREGLAAIVSAGG